MPVIIDGTHRAPLGACLAWSKDISTELGIKNAAVHYHCPIKKDLGVAIIQQARAQHKMWR